MESRKLQLKEKTVEVLGILLGLYCLYLKFWKKSE